MFFAFDPLYLWMMVIIMVISGGVQLYLKVTFEKWGKQRNAVGLNGFQVGEQLFARTTLQPIPLQRTPGVLSDHFDPGANVVRLSDPIATQPSIAALAVTAHELGHVQQYQSKSGLITMRTLLIPALQFSPTLSYFSILLGIGMNITGLIWLGIAFFSLMVLFSLLTLPVEFDASRRGLQLLREANLLTSPQDMQGAKQLLTAAGLTYLGAAIASVLQLLYVVAMAKRQS